MSPLAGPLDSRADDQTTRQAGESGGLTPTKDKRLRTRLSARRLAEIEAHLSTRDREALQLVGRFRVMSGAQLQTLLWADIAPSARGRLARRGLARLARLDVLQPLERRVGGERAGSASTTYAVGRAGQYLARAGSSKRVRAAYTPGARYLAHTLAVAQLYVHLATQQHIELLTFDPEPACWRTFMTGFGGRQVLKPDAYLILATTAREFAWFIEVDMATEALTTVAAKATRYHDYFASGTEQAAHGWFPRVLWIVPDGARAEAIRETLGSLPPEAHQLFVVIPAAQAVAYLLAEARS